MVSIGFSLRNVLLGSRDFIVNRHIFCQFVNLIRISLFSFIAREKSSSEIQFSSFCISLIIKKIVEAHIYLKNLHLKNSNILFCFQTLCNHKTKFRGYLKEYIHDFGLFFIF